MLEKKEMSKYYHYCSKGFEREILFKNPIEFIAGINRIAVCFLLCLLADQPVRILAFCLMDNHFHFILYGEEHHCDAFIARYKKLTAMWVTRHRGQPLIERMEIGHWTISFDKLAEKIIYVLRNPVAAGLKMLPSAYRWSSASLMFADLTAPRWGEVDAGTLSVTKRRIKGYTRVRLPDNWKILPDGMIWPGNYMDIRTAEKQFQSIGTYMFALNNSNIDKECEREMMKDSIMLPDGDVEKRACEIALSLFEKENAIKCSVGERIGIATILRKEMRCNHKQLGRVLHLKPSDLELVV